MQAYETELAKMEASRQELGNAEKLFDLSVTMYPELLNVQQQMRGLRQIYKIYEEQKVISVLLFSAPDIFLTPAFKVNSDSCVLL